jgi:hypothetical protein
MRDMSEIVQERLDVLGINPFEAARRAGLEKGFVNDLLIGRKQTIRRASLAKLAVALECDAEYLTGHQKTPNKVDDGVSGEHEIIGVKFGGVVENGTWRESPARMKAGEVAPTDPDRRFPLGAQTAFLIRGDAADTIGIHDGMIVIGCAPSVFEETARRMKDGDAVVVRRWRHSRSESEVSIRKISGHTFLSPDESGAPISRDDKTTELLAVVVRTIRIF